jgi:hypothetical protein
MDFFKGEGGGGGFTFLTFIHILLVALFFVIFYIYFPKIHRKIHTSLWNLKIPRKKSANKKVSMLLSNVCDFQKAS